MHPLPKRLLVVGFLIGYLVLFVAHWVIAPVEPWDLEDFVVTLMAYGLLIGSTLSVPGSCCRSSPIIRIGLIDCSWLDWPVCSRSRSPWVA